MSVDWPVVRLGDYVDSSLGKMLDKVKNKGKEQPYLGNSDVRWGYFDLSDLSQMKFEETENDRYGIKNGDLIVCEGGEPGRCAIWNEDVPDMKIQKALHRVRPKPTLNNYYLYYWFLYSGSRGLLEPYFTGTTIKHLTGKALKNLEIKLPSLDYQEYVAKVLKSLDDKIELNRQTNQTLEHIAQAIFKSWFVDFEPTRAKIAAKQIGQARHDSERSAALREALLADDRWPAAVAAAIAEGDPERAAMAAISGKSLDELDQLDVQGRTNAAGAGSAGAASPEQQDQLLTTAALFPDALVDSELGGIPEGWEAKPLYETAEYINGNAFKTKDFSSNGKGLPIIKIVELKSGLSEGTKYTEKEFKEKYFIQNEDVLYSWSGSPETSLEVFKWFGGNGWLNQHIFKLKFKSEQQKYFAYYLLKHMKPILIATAQQKQTTGLGHVTVADMKRLLVSYPEGKLLGQFKAVIAQMYDKCSSLDKETLDLSNVRDALLPKLLSGELSIESVQTELGGAA